MGDCVSFLRTIAIDFKVDVLSVEYPGYGIYEGYPNEK